MASETTPLVSKKDPLDDMHSKVSSNGEDSFVSAVSRDRTAEEFNPRPVSSTAAEFNSRPVMGRNARPTGAKTHRMKTPSVGGGFLLDFVPDAWNPTAPVLVPNSEDREDAAINTGGIGTLVLPRKVPIKLEPKVFFANERTFLTWLKVILTISSASVAILIFGKDESIGNQLFGIILLPVSVAFIFYALWQYLKRATMIKHRMPGPYIDVVGPVTLTVLIMATNITQFSMKLHSMMYDSEDWLDSHDNFTSV